MSWLQALAVGSNLVLLPERRSGSVLFYIFAPRSIKLVSHSLAVLNVDRFTERVFECSFAMHQSLILVGWANGKKFANSPHVRFWALHYGAFIFAGLPQTLCAVLADSLTLTYFYPYICNDNAMVQLLWRISMPEFVFLILYSFSKLHPWWSCTCWGCFEFALYLRLCIVGFPSVLPLYDLKRMGFWQSCKIPILTHPWNACPNAGLERLAGHRVRLHTFSNISA